MSTYLDLCQRMREGEFNYAFSISLKHKYVYVENAKAACTTLKSILGEWEFSDCQLGLDIPRAYFANVHVNVVGTPFVKPFQLGESKFNEILHDDQFFKFSFVRNPYTRILSAYLDKVQGGKPESQEIVVEAERLGLIDEQRSVSFVSFLKCLEAMCQRNQYLDKHWRPQTFQLFGEEIKYDRIGRVESFTEDLQSIAKSLGMTLGETKRVFGHETKASDQAAEYYTDEARSIVASVFKSDFEEFGYGIAPT
jgi:hypothetical protein